LNCWPEDQHKQHEAPATDLLKKYVCFKQWNTGSFGSW